MLREVTNRWSGVEVDVFDGLLVDYARKRGAGVILRGIRAVSDYEYELQMALMNRKLEPRLETVFMLPGQAYSYLSSKLVREIAQLGGPLKGLVPTVVEERLRAKIAMNKRASQRQENTVQLTDRINRIQISPTSAVIAEADKLKAKGVDIADFGPGEPDFPTPDHIKKAAIRAIEQNYTKYTPTGGILPLREAIVAWHKRELGSSYEPKECVVNVGGKHSIFNCVSVLVQQGDEVIIPAPYWVSYPDIVKYAGGTPVYVDSKPEDGFSVKASVIEKAITPKTKMVILSSPNNPTGGVIPPDEYERILAACKKHNVWLMGDECYSHFVYEQNKPYSIASVAGSKENVIIIGSMSKTFAMTGWRVGYTLAPEASDSSDGEIAKPIDVEPDFDRATRRARSHARLDGHRARDACRIRKAPQAHRRRPAQDQRRHLRMARRRVLCFPECFGASRQRPERTSAGERHDRTREALLDKARVALVPGDAFGAPGYLRLSYATSIERIDEGLRRLDRFFSRVEAAA